jgi:hypothetical protein
VGLAQPEMAVQIRIFSKIFCAMPDRVKQPAKSNRGGATCSNFCCLIKKGCQMAQDVNERAQSKTDHSGDHITIKFGGAEAKISGFRIAAFTVVLLFLGWFLVI